MKKILITGASGFIGSFLVEKAIGESWETWAGIRKSSSKGYLTDESVRFIDLNYSDKAILRLQLQEHRKKYGKWDYIIHNAGVTKCLNSSDFDKVNYLFTRNFIEALKETDNVPSKFILMSSLSAYPNPETVYGKSKLKAEQFLQSQIDFPFIIMRPTGVYGPREKDYFLMVKTIRSGFDFVPGFTPQLLTFIYVDDLVNACFLALESPLSNRSYNISDGYTYTSKEYAQIVKRALGKKQVIRIVIPLFILHLISVISEYISKITKKPSTLNRDKYKIMKQRDWRCDTISAQQELNFKAEYNLTKGMEACIQWYRENQWL